MVYGRRLGRSLRPGLRATLDERLPALAIDVPEAGRLLDVGLHALNLRDTLGNVV